MNENNHLKKELVNLSEELATLRSSGDQSNINTMMKKEDNSDLEQMVKILKKINKTIDVEVNKDKGSLKTLENVNKKYKQDIELAKKKENFLKKKIDLKNSRKNEEQDFDNSMKKKFKKAIESHERLSKKIENQKENIKELEGKIEILHEKENILKKDSNSGIFQAKKDNQRSVSLNNKKFVNNSNMQLSKQSVIC